jgi:hypothetical protein
MSRTLTLARYGVGWFLVVVGGAGLAWVVMWWVAGMMGFVASFDIAATSAFPLTVVTFPIASGLVVLGWLFIRAGEARYPTRVCHSAK